MVPDLHREQILDALRRVRGPDLSGDIVSLGMVADAMVYPGGKVVLSITVPAERARELEPLRAAAERVLRDLPGVTEALVALTAERRPACLSQGDSPVPATTLSL